MNKDIQLSTFLFLLGYETPLIIYDVDDADKVILDVSEEGFRAPCSLYYGLSPKDYDIECFTVRNNILHVWAVRR